MIRQGKQKTTAFYCILHDRAFDCGRLSSAEIEFVTFGKEGIRKNYWDRVSF